MGILDDFKNAYGRARPASGDWDSPTVGFDYYGDEHSKYAATSNLDSDGYENPVTPAAIQKKAKREAEEQARDQAGLDAGTQTAQDHMTYNDFAYMAKHFHGPAQHKDFHTSYTPVYISLGLTAVFTVAMVTLLGPVLGINTPIDRLVDFFADNNLDCANDPDCSSASKLKHIEFTSTDKDVFLGGAVVAGAGTAGSVGAGLYYGMRAHHGRQEKAKFDVLVNDLANQHCVPTSSPK